MLSSCTLCDLEDQKKNCYKKTRKKRKNIYNKEETKQTSSFQLIKKKKNETQLL